MAISTPSGSLLTFDSGPLQARVFQGSGHLALAGPDLAGMPHANVITFEPPVVAIGGKTSTIGRVVSSTPLANGFELIQDVSGTNITVQLTFPADGVMRYEITDWNGLEPDQTSVAAASDANEHFYGFGEKFNSLDQAGNVVETYLTFDNPGTQGGTDPTRSRRGSSAPAAMGSTSISTAQSTFDMRPRRSRAATQSPTMSGP